MRRIRQVVSSSRSLSDLRMVFPNRHKIPFAKEPPHPLLQECASVVFRGGIEFRTIFHKELMMMYRDYMVDGLNLFPDAAMVELGLAAGLKGMKKEVAGYRKGGVELVGVSFVKPFELSEGSAMVCEYMFGEGMLMREADEDSAFATIQQINLLASFNTGTSPIEEWQRDYTEEMKSIKDQYDQLADQGFHRRSFQTVELVWTRKDKSSMLAKINLQSAYRHKHDAFYLVHPALLDGAFQVCGMLLSNNDGAAWVPAGIDQLKMHRPLSLGMVDCKDCSEIWACVTLESKVGRQKMFSMKLCNMEGKLVLEVEGLRMAKLPLQPPKAAVYMAEWIEAPFPAGGSEDTSAALCVVKVPGYSLLTKDPLEGCGSISMSASDFLLLSGHDIP
eukprot:8697038-Ditylum_brightwellii.AAC.1